MKDSCEMSMRGLQVRDFLISYQLWFLHQLQQDRDQYMAYEAEIAELVFNDLCILVPYEPWIPDDIDWIEAFQLAKEEFDVDEATVVYFTGQTEIEGKR